ncbi:MAG: type I 3-dehydroquinate dehydratase [Candidatus Peregrinibacteria bacterium]|nr:type I 3-dehydroquinate dehydratase [Candidatus Peregrinibacteria bacterium]
MKLCIPINKSKTKEVLLVLKKAEKEADVVEIWFDEIKDLNAQNELQISTCSAKDLLYKVTKIDISKISHILSVIENIKYIDFDVSTDKNILAKIKEKFPKIQLIISSHNFEKTPPQSELETLIELMFTKGADIAKVATKANKLADSLRMLGLLSQLSAKGKKAICLCMGKHGRLTRIAGHLVGNYLMYAPLDKKESTAPGQLTLKELKKIIKSNN